ncbi:hypothetical protein J6590_072807 [Homalodisca vitripennis]|nr:hypothetical protein J6590_072807 [Homalodisca vitripennis]
MYAIRTGLRPRFWQCRDATRLGSSSSSGIPPSSPKTDDERAQQTVIMIGATHFFSKTWGHCSCIDSIPYSNAISHYFVQRVLLYEHPTRATNLRRDLSVNTISSNIYSSDRAITNLKPLLSSVRQYIYSCYYSRSYIFFPEEASPKIATLSLQ